MTLTVTDDLGRSATAAQAVNVYASGARAYFEATQRADGTLTVDFDASLSGSPNGLGDFLPGLKYGWNFGDGPNIAGSDVMSHTYPSPGNYSVSLLVRDAATGLPDTIIVIVEVIAAPVT